MPDYKRGDRLSDELKRVLDEIIRERLKDPRVPDMFSLTSVSVTNDLRHAKIGVSLYETEGHSLKDCMDALRHAASFLRREVGQRMNIRYVPELTFVEDTGIAHSAHIQAMLNRISEGEQEGKHD